MIKGDREYVKSLFPELALVSNPEWAEKAIDLWVYFWKESLWEDINDAPFHATLPENASLIQHTQSVLKGSLALANVIVEIQHEKNINFDTLILGACLHDVSKLVEYCGKDENGAVKSEDGKLYQHAFLGAAKAREIGLPKDVVKIILNHAGDSKRLMGGVEGLLIKGADHSAACAAIHKYDF